MPTAAAVHPKLSLQHCNYHYQALSPEDPTFWPLPAPARPPPATILPSRTPPNTAPLIRLIYHIYYFLRCYYYYHYWGAVRSVRITVKKTMMMKIKMKIGKKENRKRITRNNKKNDRNTNKNKKWNEEPAFANTRKGECRPHTPRAFGSKGERPALGRNRPSRPKIEVVISVYLR